MSDTIQRERTDGVPRAAEPFTPGVFVAGAVPMTLLDLDAAGLDPTQPAPPEFVQFLYDNSRTGYLTLWSAHLSQPDGGAMINRWIQNALEVYHARALQMQVAPAGPKPAGSNVTEVAYEGPTAPAAPAIVDVPYLSGPGVVGQTLSCTMGNWLNEPTEYAYAFSGAGVATGNTYVVDAADAGTSITCVVSATNAGGTTEAPPSNVVMIAGSAATATATAERTVPRTAEPAHGSRRDYGKKE